MLTRARLAVAIEQVEMMAQDMGAKPLDIIVEWKKGNDTQKQVYAEILKKYPPIVKDPEL